MGATNNFIGANFILGQANLIFPDYEIQRWHTVLVTYLMAISVTLVNIYGPHLLDKISKGMLVWNIASFFIVIITLLATQDN
jgi:choline transport protein